MEKASIDERLMCRALKQWNSQGSLNPKWTYSDRWMTGTDDTPTQLASSFLVRCGLESVRYGAGVVAGLGHQDVEAHDYSMVVPFSCAWVAVV